MAAFISLAELSDREQINLLLSALGTIGAILFSALCWMAKLAIRREMDRRNKQAEARDQWERDQDNFRQWVRVIFALHGMLPKPIHPSDKLDPDDFDVR